MIRKKKCVKPATEAQKNALRAIAKSYNRPVEDICWIVSGQTTQIIDNLSYQQVAKFLHLFQTNQNNQS